LPLLGADQMCWLREAQETRKVIAADMPIGMMVMDGDTAIENSPNGDGPVLGREQDIAAATGVMTVSMMDVADTVLWSVDLDPVRA
jgi:alkaline phosphatase D